MLNTIFILYISLCIVYLFHLLWSFAFVSFVCSVIFPHFYNSTSIACVCVCVPVWSHAHRALRKQISISANSCGGLLILCACVCVCDRGLAAWLSHTAPVPSLTLRFHQMSFALMAGQRQPAIVMFYQPEFFKPICHLTSYLECPYSAQIIRDEKQHRYCLGIIKNYSVFKT